MRPMRLTRIITAVIVAISLIPGKCFSQVTLILNDSTPYQRIGKFVYYLPDPERKLRFEDINTTTQKTRFIKSEQESNNLGNKDMAVWNYFQVCKTTNEEWLLEIESYNIDTAELYYPDTLTGEYKKVVSGRFLPFTTKKYKSNSFVFDLPIRKNDTATIYLKIDTYYMQYPLSVSTKLAYIEEAHQRDLLAGIYYGLVIVFMFYNFFVFLNVKDKDYLYYVVYIFFNAIFIGQLKGFNAELFGDNFHFLWNYAPGVIGLTSMVSFIFTRRILETKKRVPRWDRIILYFFYPNYILIMVLSVAGQNLYASLLNQFSGLLALVFLFTLSIKVYKGGFRPARYYIFGSFFYFIGVLIFTIKGMNLLPFSFITNNAIEIGSTLQMIIFSFVIGDRLKIFKVEKERAQDDLVKSLQENEKLILGQKKMLEIKVKERTQELEEEKERSESLLLNILPEETAQELKEKGFSEPRLYDSVTVLFTDFKDFTKISEHLSPRELVQEIDICFRAFDDIVAKYNVEKIKTIGDSYMAAGGLPVENDSHPEDVVKAGTAMLRFINEHNKKRIEKHLIPMDIRIGIHTGSVIAGIVGTKKFAYDIWGDTVNTASRMESSGEPGKINISGTTYERVKELFSFTHRGKIAAKNKGMIDMYFLDHL
ncbi:MAG TPA: adenylate/guanylate cyclase domain-containing protein [Chitinophagaceae bacterium]|nr:hypothetical protein [Chitinophagales bacterium]HPG12806.1 adenylate/guanylate cyclase domain-containing protein [Chitinophagaceae bacterium]HRX93016.1 adenylate/guanylate cyclase domain-containing protein [Chitinophagaceae bacterium]